MKILFRADASVEQGVGHVMRSLVLAQEFHQQDHDVVFLSDFSEIPWLEEYFSELPFQRIKVRRHTLNQKDFKKFDPDWIVTDSYEIPAAAISEVNTKIPVLAIIDGDTRGICATVFLDQSPQFKASSFENSTVQMWGGIDYALIRSDLAREWFSAASHGSEDDGSVLVMLGGTDATGAMNDVISALVSVGVQSVDVIGATGQVVSKFKHEQSSTNIRFHAGGAGALRRVAKPLIAITAAGTSALEFFSVGVPVLAVAVASNQLSNLEFFASEKLALGIDWTKNRDTAVLADLVASALESPGLLWGRAQKATALVDGRGASRVAQIIQDNYLS